MRYDELAPMLLNAMQQQIAAQAQTNATQADGIAAHEAQLRDMQRQLTEMHTALIALKTKDELVAQR